MTFSGIKPKQQFLPKFKVEKLGQLVYEHVSIVLHKTEVFFEDSIVRSAKAEFIFLNAV